MGAGFHLKFELEGETQLSRKLQDVAKASFKKEMKSIGGKIVHFTKKDVFNTEGRALGKKWADGPSYNGLMRTGKMRNSFKYEADKDSVRVYNTDPKFKYHQSNKPRKQAQKTIKLSKKQQYTSTIINRDGSRSVSIVKSRKESGDRLPRRVMLKLTKEMKEMAVKEIQKGVQKEPKKRA